MQEKLDKIIDKLNETAITVARIDERLQSSMKTIAELEGDMNNLKRWRWTVVGAVSALSLGAQLILKQMVK